MDAVWDLMLSLITGVSSLWVFTVPVLVMAAIAFALRLAHNRFF